MSCEKPGGGGGGLLTLGAIMFSGAAGYYMYVAMKNSAKSKHVSRCIEECQSRTRLQKDNFGRQQVPPQCKTPPTPCSMPMPSADVEKFRSRIVSLSADELLQEVADGRFTVLQVLQSYTAEACRVDQKTNCITEFLEEAEELAKFLDTVEIKGPLHGLPVSLKETFNLKCHDCTAGLAKFLGKPCQRDAVLVQVLKKLGAVPFVRTNIVQTTCSFGNSNPLYGETLHPLSPDRIPGGSTCGEGSLIALGGSVLGLGSDVGGSLRIPAAMCGIYSLKPTQNRLSGVGVKKTIDGLTGLHDVPGLMSREVGTLITVFRAIVSPVMFEMDARVVPLPFQKELFNCQRPLRIGYYEDDGLILPTPGCTRAVQVAKAALEKMGHECVQFCVPKVQCAFELTMSLFSADGGKTIDEMMDGEPVSDPLAYIKNTFQDKIMKFLQPKCSKHNFCRLAVTEKSTYELWKLLAQREEYVDLFTQTWRSMNLDAVLAPGFALPAFHSSFIIPLGETVFITMLYNMLNFPVGSVPVCRESEADQMALQTYPEEPQLCRTMKRAAAGAVGMPLGVQVVGLPWEEEMVLRVMKDLETSLKAMAADEMPCPTPTPPISGSCGPPTPPSGQPCVEPTPCPPCPPPQPLCPSPQPPCNEPKPSCSVPPPTCSQPCQPKPDCPKPCQQQPQCPQPCPPQPCPPPPCPPAPPRKPQCQQGGSNYRSTSPC